MKIVTENAAGFFIKEIVWAKVKGYPWWPAEVYYLLLRYLRCPIKKIVSIKLYSSHSRPSIFYH